MIEQYEARSAAGRQSPFPATREEAVPTVLAQGPAAAGEASNWIVGEPSIPDLLRDSLVHAVLRRDGLTLQDLLQAVALGRRRLSPPPAESDAA